jgi:hypothetical protein
MELHSQLDGVEVQDLERKTAISVGIEPERLLRPGGGPRYRLNYLSWWNCL